MGELVRATGVTDNAAFYARWMEGDRFFEQLFVSAVNVEPFTGNFDDPGVPTMAFLVWYVRGIDVSNKSDKNLALAGMMADLMAPAVDINKIVSQEAAGNMIIRYVRILITRENLLGILSDGTREQFIATEDENYRGTAEEWDAIVNPATVYSPAMVIIAIKILRYVAATAKRAFKVGGITMIVHVYIACIKRGNITDKFANKIVTGLEADLGISQFEISAEVCNALYRNFSTYLDDTTMPTITQRWTGLLPARAMRLQLTVAQASGSGLTSLITIGRAIRIHTKFNWARIQSMFPDEWSNFTTAVRTVGDNVWYGYKKDIGVASSTKFKNIAYVAKDLMIKVSGETALSYYAGWVRRAKYQSAVDILIATYEDNMNRLIIDDVPFDDPPTNNAVDDLKALVTENSVIYA